MKQLTIPFEKVKVRIPIIRIKYRDTRIDAIVDTGSESTIFDINFLKDNDLVSESTKEMSLVGVNGEGESVNIYQLDDIPLLFEGKDQSVIIPTDGISANLSGINEHISSKYKDKIKISVIFGNDFLKKHKTKINYKSKELTLFYDIPGE